MITLFQEEGKGIRMARKLLQRGAQINYVNSNGNTALHLCVQNKLVKSCEFLLQKGANQYIMDFNGKCACDMAMENDFVGSMYEFVNCNINKKVKVKAGSWLPPLTPEEIHAAKTQ